MFWKHKQKIRNNLNHFLNSSHFGSNSFFQASMPFKYGRDPAAAKLRELGMLTARLARAEWAQSWVCGPH